MTASTASRSRPASGITIDPEQLARMRDLRALSREDLAERTGEVLFDYARFPRILRGEVPANAQMARALWLALDVTPGDVIRGIPPELPRSAIPRWLRRNTGWHLDTASVDAFREQRGWPEETLASATSRHWFSRDSVAKIERGERRPKARTLRAFCQILKCEPPGLMPGSEPLPDGHTKEHRAQLDYNAGMREWADAQDPPVPYRAPGRKGKRGRIRYPQELKDRYAAWLAEQDTELAS